MPLVVVVVGDRTSKISRNKVDSHVQNCQLRVVAPPLVRECVKQSYDQ